MEWTLNEKGEQVAITPEMKEMFEPEYLDLMDVSGKKVRFEIVSVVTVEKRIFIIVKNPEANGEDAKLAMFEYVEKDGQGRYHLVTDLPTIQRVNWTYNENMKKMKEEGIIPPFPKAE